MIATETIETIQQHPPTAMVNALSFDVEEYFHVHAFKHVIQQQDWHRYESRVVPSTRRILRVLQSHGTHATFFILGWVAEQHPELVREIADCGHEIASHGYAHQAVHELSRTEFASDLQRAGDAITAACPAAELKGYRAPSFSINESTPWAFDELKRAGFCYDSSLSPASLHDRYGVRGAPRFVHSTANGIIEIPPSTVRVARQNLPVAGGGHFRLAPLWITRSAVRRINREGHPAVSYLHPWEFDPAQPRIRGAGQKSRFRHYLNLKKTEQRLDGLLQTFRFARMDVVFASQLATQANVVEIARAAEVNKRNAK